MSTSIVYQQVRQMLDQTLDQKVDDSTKERIALLVLGIIRAESASPARIAEALEQLGLTNATAESIERRIRRIENDPEILATTCFYTFAKQQLNKQHPDEFIIALDPTTQDDRVVMVSASICYRGRTLPLAWVVWPANKPLEGDRFWKRISALLDVVKDLLPTGVFITWVADRAFGTPAFTDMITAYGWHYVVRVQRQTLCKNKKGVERQIVSLVKTSGRRVKMNGKVFKKYNWRPASVVVFWGKRHEEPLCIVSDLPASWSLIHIYQKRYPIETTFRDYKSNGWHWEQGQVKNIEHTQRLLVGMALATWVVLYAGTQVASEYLSKAPTGNRRTVPWIGKRSLFHIGLQRLKCLFSGSCHINICFQFTDWDAPNWQKQIYSHHAYGYIFSNMRKKVVGYA